MAGSPPRVAAEAAPTSEARRLDRCIGRQSRSSGGLVAAWPRQAEPTLDRPRPGCADPAASEGEHLVLCTEDGFSFLGIGSAGMKLLASGSMSRLKPLLQNCHALAAALKAASPFWDQARLDVKLTSLRRCVAAEAAPAGTRRAVAGAPVGAASAPTTVPRGRVAGSRDGKPLSLARAILFHCDGDAAGAGSAAMPRPVAAQ